jgi:S1-C subfamily serine protease
MSEHTVQPAATPPGRSRRPIAVAGIGALAVVGIAIGVAYALPHETTVSGTGSLAQSLPTTDLPRWGGTNGGANGGTNGGTNGGANGGTNGGTSGGTDSSSSTGTATAAQSFGVVDINTVLGYQSARAAGTGTIVTSGGEVLTNNHVVAGATSITVTVVSTGTTYKATVVGTDPTEDVAVLQLTGASGLHTANYANSSDVAVGARVTGVGNAGGAGGTPSAATGVVTALDQSITATDENGDNPEQLTGLIETDAPIQAGDSGGPLYDSSGQIVGMDTAASTTGGGQQTAAGYAIEIDHALQVADEIESATSSTSTINIGSPAFLGVSVVAADVQGAAVAQVVQGGPADSAGVAAGDVITAVGGTAITTGDQLKTALAHYSPGQSVTITWTNTVGQSQHATVTLATGPID